MKEKKLKQISPKTWAKDLEKNIGPVKRTFRLKDGKPVKVKGLPVKVRKIAELILSVRQPSMTVQALMTESHATAKTKGWWKNHGGRAHYIPKKLFLAMGELAEAGEEIRNGHAPTEVYYKDGKPEGFPIEIADCIIRLADLCQKEGINLDYALRAKMGYNRMRPYLHGNKKF